MGIKDSVQKVKGRFGRSPSEAAAALAEGVAAGMPGDPKAAGEALGKISDSASSIASEEEITFREQIRQECEYWKEALGKATSPEERDRVHSLYLSAKMRMEEAHSTVRHERNGLMRGAVTVSFLIAVGITAGAAYLGYEKLKSMAEQ